MTPIEALARRLWPPISLSTCTFSWDDMDFRLRSGHSGMLTAEEPLERKNNGDKP